MAEVSHQAIRTGELPEGVDRAVVYLCESLTPPRILTGSPVLQGLTPPLDGSVFLFLFCVCVLACIKNKISKRRMLFRAIIAFLG